MSHKMLIPCAISFFNLVIIDKYFEKKELKSYICNMKIREVIAFKNYFLTVTSIFLLTISNK